MSDQIRLTRPTIASSRGGVPLKVGKSVYHLPTGSSVVHVQGARLAYALCFDGLHAFIEAGEITLSQPLRDAITRKFFSPRRFMSG